MGHAFTEDRPLNVAGYISAYLHEGEPVFTPVGGAEGQGYYRLPPGELRNEMHVKNLIVDKASAFMAKRMRPGANWGTGITHLEVGTGTGSGTIQNPQAESPAQTQLRSALQRKAINAWTYLDAQNQPTASETNVLQLTVAFDKDEANGAITEMGLFGGDATSAVGTGYMYNHKTFPVWNKQVGMKLTIVWKLTF